MSDIDLGDAQVAGFMAVEDLLIDFRDSRLSIFPYANGVVVNEKDGSPSPVVRMRTRHATDLAIETAAPLIEAQVRAQDADEIEAAIESMRRNVQSTYSLWPGMEFAVEMLRGDS